MPEQSVQNRQQFRIEGTEGKGMYRSCKEERS